MKISIQSLRAFNERYGCVGDIAPQGASALAEVTGAQLGAVEERIDIGARYQGIIIAKVVACEDHPNADKLHVCRLDDGGKAAGVARDDHGHVQVVCGAPNVREGLLVAWLPPGATVPESVGKDPFVLEVRELRGVVSNGMLASPRELALGDSHEGILELEGDIAPGTDFAEHYYLKDDVVLDIENKMFTHRPDCFGFLGVDRELAGIQGMAFKSPDWYRADAPVPEVEAEPLALSVRNEIPELVKRFCAIAMRDVQVKPSPVWLQTELARLGARPINSIVDLTNFIMLETGQPLHAYDYDKLKALDSAEAATLVVRHPQGGEKIKLLNGKEIEPRAEAMMIASATTLVGVGGVMGGFDTEVDDNTKNIVIEAANFDMYSIRRTSMAHGLFTDAVTRFNKGQSPLQTRTVLAKIVSDVQQLAGGKVASKLIDDNHVPAEVMARNSLYAPVNVSVQFINERLGVDLSADTMRTLLTNVEFTVEEDNGNLTVQAPFWRTDIEIPEDIVEEVGRLYGFDHLPLLLPKRGLAPARKDPLIETKSAIRSALSRAGANEILAYSFVHGKLLERAGQDPAQTFKLSNALSPDLQYFRMSLTPSLLDKVHPNVKAGYDHFALFEIGKGHLKGQFEDQDRPVPKEYDNLALVVTANDKQRPAGAPFYQARHYLETLAASLGTVLRFEAPSDNTAELAKTQAAAPYDPARSAFVYLGDAEQPLGMVGEFKPSVLRAFKLPAYTAGFEIGIVPELRGEAASRYQSLSKYPKVEQDLCLRVPAGTSYQQLLRVVSEALSARLPEDSYSSLSPVDIYQRQDDSDHKQITIRFSVASYAKTLRDREVADLLDAVASVAAEQLQAEKV